MKIRLIAVCVLLLCVLPRTKSPADDGQQPPKESIRIEVMLLESSASLKAADRKRLSGETEQVVESVEAMARDGKLKVVNHAEMVVLEDQRATLQVGGTVSIKTGSTRNSGGRSMTVYQDVSIGTLISLTAVVVEEDVLIDMNFAKSFVSDDQADAPESREGTSQVTLQSSLKIKSGNAQLMGGMTNRTDDANQGSLLIVAVERIDAEVKETESSESSESSESTVQESVIGDVQIEFVPELGTIMLRGKSNDVKRVQEIIDIIQRQTDQQKKERDKE